MKKGKKIVLLLTAAVAALVLACGLYASDYYRAEDGALGTPAGVTVELSENRAVFLPDAPRAGLVFYPGGKVEFTAYAPLMARLAEQGVLCVLVKMPFNLAVLDMDAAKDIPEEFSQVDRWYLAGHSLGGSMAASFAAEQPEVYEGVILLAAYSTADLTDTGLKALSIYGDRDGVLNREKYAQYRPNLPGSLEELVIEGGNHAHFGAYGPQEGDGEAVISAQEQQAWTVEAVCTFLFGEENP